ncbi:GntR family transcriptional regulator [Streptomonospora nanhaiensis]|uniref:GntR family transcriptional regulator n=1 Tax=Streptomonospora nanhaiensis TaxID=1323731 RepID=A0A853BR41_9ACTN|nr:GntR family transcriptional regulator [Streptomonospora nanhaiensis]MBV2364029.1 GntR family transcriptional regulator [Streptomonospora nanhaiensis]MBX9387373.1 GntR family transcriptional regulator [Streptomonospora nanhaiensis]NYI97027.1 GntR family transcriptional regulator [Streptomonospora nanhaiensis]
MDGRPRYLWVADRLRRPILNGELEPGTRLPSRSRLARTYDVSEQVSRHALRLLVSEGLVEARPGSGYYVRPVPQIHRFSRTDRTSGSGVDPLERSDLGTQTDAVCGAVARRLGVRDGERVFRTRCLGLSDGAPVALHTAWEPAALTQGTLRTPADSEPGTSVLQRLGAAGVIIDRVVEEVGVRPLREPESSLLHLAPGLPVLVVERTHYSGRRPVETSDLVGSVDHCRLLYRLSLARAPKKPR